MEALIKGGILASPNAARGAIKAITVSPEISTSLEPMERSMSPVRMTRAMPNPIIPDRTVVYKNPAILLLTALTESFLYFRITVKYFTARKPGIRFSW
jgi:hypothetical protein